MQSQADIVVNILTEQLANVVKENAILQADLSLAREKVRALESEEKEDGHK